MKILKLGAESAYRVRKRTGDAAMRILRTLFFIGMSYVLLNPIFIMVSRAFRSSADMLNPTIVWIPQNVTLDNFKLAIKITDFTNTARLTFRVAIISTLCTMIERR